MKIFVTIEDGVIKRMSEATQNGPRYAIPYSLDDLTIGEMQELMKYIEENAPQKYLESIGNGDHTKKEWSSCALQNAEFLCKVISHIAGFSAESFNGMDYTTLKDFCSGFEANIIAPMYYLGAYEPKGINEFTHNGVTYQLPKLQADGVGGLIPHANVTAEEWAESNDLMMACENPIEYAPLIIAILCRPEGEPYNESKARERAEEFKSLPAYMAYEVFFVKCLQMSTILSLIQKPLAEMVAKDKELQAKVQKTGLQMHGMTE